MSMNLIIKGTFKNGKVRTIGLHSTKGMEIKNQFDEEDTLFLARRLEDDNMSFNRCLELGKFVEVQAIFKGDYCNNKGENKLSSHWGLFIDERKRIEAKEFMKDINALIISNDMDINQNL